MRTPSRRRRPLAPTPTTLTRLVAELRELPVGLETPVVAGLLVADVLSALGYGPERIGALLGLPAVREVAR